MFKFHIAFHKIIMDEKQYHFNVFFLLFKTVFNLIIYFKQKIDPKMRMFKNLEEI